MNAPRATVVSLRLGALLIAVPVMVALAAPPAAAQEEEDLTAGVQALRRSYDRARAAIDSLDFAGAIQQLAPVLGPQRAAPGDLRPEELSIVCAAYDLRGRAYFNLGKIKEAQADFEALIRLQPAYPIDRQTLSPKVVDLFDKTLARMAGFLVLTISPPHARLTVDGETVEPDDQGRLPILAGRHVVRLESEGFDPQSETVAILAGTEARATLRLRPNRRALQFITVPAGVAVLIDGAPAGTTSGPATSEVEALAVQYRFDVKTASAPLVVPLVAPGEHRVTFERACYQPRTLSVKVVLDPETNTPLRFAPVVLQEARTDLSINSTPPGAEVTVDGDPKGRTPVTVTGACAGERNIVVDGGPAGSWIERVRLTQGRKNVLDVRLRPTLLYAGTFLLDEWGRAVWSDQDRPLLDELNQGLKTLNVIHAPEILEPVRAGILKWLIADPRAARAGTIAPPAVLEEAARKARADLVLAGLRTSLEPSAEWTLALYSVQHPTPDLVTVRSDRPETIRVLVRRLDTALEMTALWWGVGLADVPGGGDPGAAETTPFVVRVLPGGPAAQAGLKAGDRIQSVNGRTPKGAREARDFMNGESARPGGVRAAVTLAVADAAGTRTVRLTAGEGPRILPLADPDVLYNRALAEFRLRSRATAGDADRAVAHLNLGLAYMHFREYERANADGLARSELAPGPGVSAGSVQYYRGLCALRRGDPRAARVHLETAAQATGSTLDTGDGPSAAAAAARLLATLP